MSDVKTYKMMIGGEWVDASGGDTFESMNPFTRQDLGLDPEGR